MGVKLKNLIESNEISLDELNSKVLAIDSMNMLYQFLTTIRQRDGSLLLNNEGKVTSHINGLFYRCTKFIEKGLKMVFVFDGKPPKLKSGEIERRTKIKEEARKMHEKALKDKNLDLMKSYASRTTKLTKEMVDESKKFLDALGIPHIQAPSEGEAQAAYLTQKGDAHAVVSQDLIVCSMEVSELLEICLLKGKEKGVGVLNMILLNPR